MNIEEVLRKYNYKPDASLDQHFLKDEVLVKRLIKKLDVKKSDIIFEVGSGIGTFTLHIPACRKIYAVDIDEGALSILKKEVKRKDVEIIQGDAIREIGKKKFNKILSSTPYTICEPLIKKMFIAEFELAILIVPEQFSRVITSKKSQLGILANAFLEIAAITAVPRESFNPIPRTDSIALEISKKPINIMQQLYLQRDKKLKNALREALIKTKKVTKKEARRILEKEWGNANFLDKNIMGLTVAELEILDKFVTASG